MAIPVGIDIGRSATKFASSAGVGLIPACIARGTIRRVLPAKGVTSRSVAVRIDDVDWLIGEDATMGTNFVWQFDEQKGGLKSRLSIIAVLGLLGINEAEIVVGLPTSLAENKKARETAKQAFCGEWRATVNGREMFFKINAQIVAEPLGSYFKLVLDEQAQPLVSSPYYRSELAIVDIGLKTLDVATIRNGGLGEAKGSSLSGGTLTVFEKAWKLLEQNHGVMLKANDRVKVYEAVTSNFGTKFTRINGENISPGFWTEVNNLKRQLAFDIVDEVRGILGNTSPDFICVTGGGALFLREELSAAEKSWRILDDGLHSNAVGFYRAAQASVVAGARG